MLKKLLLLTLISQSCLLICANQETPLSYANHIPPQVIWHLNGYRIGTMLYKGCCCRSLNPVDIGINCIKEGLPVPPRTYDTLVDLLNRKIIWGDSGRMQALSIMVYENARRKALLPVDQTAEDTPEPRTTIRRARRGSIAD